MTSHCRNSQSCKGHQGRSTKTQMRGMRLSSYLYRGILPASHVLINVYIYMYTQTYIHCTISTRWQRFPVHLVTLQICPLTPSLFFHLPIRSCTERVECKLQKERDLVLWRRPPRGRRMASPRPIAHDLSWSKMQCSDFKCHEEPCLVSCLFPVSAISSLVFRICPPTKT